MYVVAATPPGKFHGCSTISAKKISYINLQDHTLAWPITMETISIWSADLLAEPNTIALCNKPVPF